MVTKTKTLLELIDERILDLELTAGNPTFSDPHRMAARARIEELAWVMRDLKKVKDGNASSG